MKENDKKYDGVASRSKQTRCFRDASTSRKNFKNNSWMKETILKKI